MAVSSRRYLFEIPLDYAVVKYLRFMPLENLESTTDLTKPKYLTTFSKGSRYRLEEMGIAGLECPFQAESISSGHIQRQCFKVKIKDNIHHESHDSCSRSRYEAATSND